MWRTKDSVAASTSWEETEALNFHDTTRGGTDRVVKGDIVPYYDEYMGGSKGSALGFSCAAHVFCIPKTPRARRAHAYSDRSGKAIILISISI